MFRDTSIGVYEKIFSSPAEPPINSSFAFIVGLYADILKSGMWPIVSHEPFDSEEAEWPPPACIKDVISGGYSIYHKGEIRASTAEECVGLEKAAVWDATMSLIESWVELNIFRELLNSWPTEQARRLR